MSLTLSPQIPLTHHFLSSRNIQVPFNFNSCHSPCFGTALALLNSDVYLNLFGLPTGLEMKPGSREAILPLLEGEGTLWSLGSLGRKCHPVPQTISITTAGDGGQDTMTRVRHSSKPVSIWLMANEASIQGKVWKAEGQPNCTTNTVSHCHKLQGQVSHTGENHMGQHMQSALDEPHPGKATTSPSRGPLPGKRQDTGELLCSKG